MTEKKRREIMSIIKKQEREILEMSEKIEKLRKENEELMFQLTEKTETKRAEKENEKQTKNYFSQYKNLQQMEGYEYLCSIIAMVVSDHKKINSIWTILYSETAKKYQIAVKEVEPKVNETIEAIWNEMDIETKEELQRKSKRASNKEIIEFFANKIRSKNMRH